MNQPCLLQPQGLPRAALVTEVNWRCRAEPQGLLWTRPGIGTEQCGEVQGQEAVADLYSSCQEDQWTLLDCPASEAEHNFRSFVQSLRCLGLQILQEQCSLKDDKPCSKKLYGPGLLAIAQMLFSSLVMSICKIVLSQDYLLFTLCSNLCIDRSHA